MLRYFFYHLFWSLSNYILRNPYARKAAGRGCFFLLLLGVGIMLLSAILSAIGAAAAAFRTWVNSTPNSTIILTGIGLALLAGGSVFALVVRPAWREWLSRSLRTLKTYLNRPTATTSGIPGDGTTSAVPSANDLAKIRFLDETESPGSAPPGSSEIFESNHNLSNQIVIHGEE